MHKLTTTKNSQLTSNFEERNHNIKNIIIIFLLPLKFEYRLGSTVDLILLFGLYALNRSTTKWTWWFAFLVG